jgi:hypothetical protein
VSADPYFADYVRLVTGTVQVPSRIDGSAPYFVIIIRGEALPGVVGAAGEIEKVSHAL